MELMLVTLETGKWEGDEFLVRANFMSDDDKHTLSITISVEEARKYAIGGKYQISIQ